ncbi:MAG: ADP-ribosylglycohydrolase family protein [Tannerella sp.]|jgi:hypothetical protein|nr:ADP-ribosylglycohydrolase family protein [Tannerella sp.]
MKKTYLFLAVLLTFALSACQSEKSSVLNLPVDEYESKMKAAWIGQMVGVGRGFPTEFKWRGEIIPEKEVPLWTPETVNQYEQDDLYMEMIFLESMDKYGIDVSTRSAGIDFANTRFPLFCANYRGRENLREGIAPPASGHPRFNINCDDIDYQIEADYSGIIAPGMPQVAIDLGEKFGSMMNYGDGMYAGQFVGGMYAAAFFESDLEKIIQKGLECIPDSSLYAACMRDVIAWYHLDTLDWQGTWNKIMDKYYRTLDNQPLHRKGVGAWLDIDVKINGSFIVLGLLYGHGDIDSTFQISVRSGFDSDCNPSSALGILFTSKGMENIPEKYYSALNESRKFSYTRYNFPELLAVSGKLAKLFIERQGGGIKKDRDGRACFVIPVKQPVPSKLVRSWDPEQVADEASVRLTEEEMKEIRFVPSKLMEQVMKAFTPAPDLKIWNVTKASCSQFVSLAGRDKVLQLGGFEMSGPLPVPDVEKPEIKFSVMNEPGKTYRLSVVMEHMSADKSVFEFAINDSLTAQGWYDITCDLSKYRGKSVGFWMTGENSDEDNKIFISNMRIE